MDFSKPVNSTQNSIDISTDSITTDIRLPDHLYTGTVLFISDGVMHMLFGGGYNFTNTVWNFNLKTQKFYVQDSGFEDRAQGAAIAFDTEKQVGWYYGGLVKSNGGGRYFQDLYRLDRGKGTPTKVDVKSSVEVVSGGELVYLNNIGEAGILVLIDLQMVSMVDLINKCVILATNTFPQQPIGIVYIFDIATNTWFTERTTAQEKYPGGRNKVCSVVASAEDNSSHNIYIYSGYNEDISTNETATNEILILTLPAFHWILVYPSDCGNGTCDTRRVYSHKCQKVYEKQW